MQPLRACPHGAIAFDEGNRPVIDADACSSCGICLGICDAFTSSRVTMVDLHERIQRIALRGEDVVLTCNENVFPGLEPAANVVVLPCLAALSPEFWTLVLAENIPVKLAADLSYCTDCERAGDMGEMLFSHAVETAEAWSGRTVACIDEIPEKENLIRDLANPTGVDRRGAFENIMGDMSDIASGKRRLRNSEVLQQFYERRERARALARLNLNENAQLKDFTPDGVARKRLQPKRQLLLQAIAQDPSIASRVAVTVSEVDPSLCCETCDCTVACPTGARYRHPATGVPEFDVTSCIGCGACVPACPESALNLVEKSAVVFLGDEEDGKKS